MKSVIVIPPDPAWPQAFATAAAQIAEALGSNLLEIHHVGSTSIPSIYAKPVIDMLPVVHDLAVVDENAHRMEALGYVAMGEFGISGRRYFRRDNEAGVRTHQAHVFAAGSPHVDRHVAFRDFLRAHPDTAREYSDLKRRVAAAHPDDMNAYMDGKDPFIKDVEARALTWAVGE